MNWKELHESVRAKVGPFEHDSEGPLTPEEAAHLRMAGLRFQYAGAKEEAILNVLGTSPWRHHQTVNALLDRPESMEHNGGEFAPTVKRLQRQRDERRKGRALSPRQWPETGTS